MIVPVVMLVLAGLCQTTPVSHQELQTDNVFNLTQHLYPINSIVGTASLSTTAPQKLILILNETEYSTADLYAAPYPILIADEERNTWRYISRPFYEDGTTMQGLFGGGDKKKSEERGDSPPMSRYEVEGTALLPAILEPKIPISSCIDSTRGSGGSISKSISFTFTSGVSGTLGLADAILDFLTVSTTAGVSNSFGLTLAVGCTANAGESVQMFLSPWAIEASTRYRKLIDQRGVRMEASSGWSNFFSSEWGINVPPETYCFTSADGACKLPGLDRAAVDVERVTYI